MERVPGETWETRPREGSRPSTIPKVDRRGRESERPIVPKNPVKAGGGKGPCLGVPKRERGMGGLV